VERVSNRRLDLFDSVSSDDLALIQPVPDLGHIPTAALRNL